jgi:uncharacterized protein (DUF2267 family)
MTADMDEADLSSFYQDIAAAGKLRTTDHARRWSSGVLNTFGLCLSRGTKKALSKRLPEELADSLNGVFWLLHFRNPSMSKEEFLLRVGRRSGNTDAEFAYYPTLAVFSGIRQFIDEDLDSEISKALPQEVQELWQEAARLKTPI